MIVICVHLTQRDLTAFLTITLKGMYSFDAIHSYHPLIYNNPFIQRIILQVNDHKNANFEAVKINALNLLK